MATATAKRKSRVAEQPRHLTTGEAALVCGVSQQAIIRCIDKGELEGFRLGTMKQRFVPVERLYEFMRRNNVPMDRLDSIPGFSRVPDREPGLATSP